MDGSPRAARPGTPASAAGARDDLRNRWPLRGPVAA